MATLAVLYATRHGQTQRVAERTADFLRARRHAVEVMDVRALVEPFALERFGGVILAASVHTGRHEREMISFVRPHRAELRRVPTAFFSVSMSAATMSDASSSEAARAKARADVQRAMDVFFRTTRFHPTRECPIAGALRYTRYGFLLRAVMKQITKRAGGPTDTTRDHELTDWVSLERTVDDFARTLPTLAAPAGTDAATGAAAPLAPRHVLVATDFGPGAEAALDQALALAATAGGRITLAHVYDVSTLAGPDALVLAGGKLVEEFIREANEELEHQAEGARGRGAAVTCELRPGHPAQALVDLADELAVDLIVMGTHGRKGVSRALLGSVAESVVRRATVPVLVVRSPPRTRETHSGEHRVPSPAA